MLDLSIMPPSSPDAEALGKAYLLFHENIARVCTFRAVAIAGLEVGAVAAQEQFFKDIAASTLISQLGPVPEEMFPRLKALVLERKRSDAAASSDAACLILAHSVFEALVHELIDILPSARREFILKNIGERKLRICDLEGANLDELLAAEVLRYVSELKRDSLKKKLAFIFGCCGFDKSCQEPGYSFDQEQLIAIDKERQKIIHHSIFGQPLLGIESTLAFLLHTGDFLVCLVSRGTGLEVNVRSASMPLMKHFEDESKAFRTVTSLAGSVNDAMERWADWVVTGHGAQAQADKVQAVYLEYQEVMNTVFNLVQQLKANRFADHSALNDAVMQADSVAQTVTQLIESLLFAGQSTAVQTDTGVKP
jgi:hypothetical protein